MINFFRVATQTCQQIAPSPSICTGETSHIPFRITALKIAEQYGCCRHTVLIEHLNIWPVTKCFPKFLKGSCDCCAHEICVPAAGMPPAEHENAKTRKPENGENGGNAKHENGKKRKRENGENAKTAKTRKRAKQESRFCRKQKNTTINYRTSNQRRTEMGKTQEDGNAKTRKQQKMFSFSSCLVLHRSSPFRSTLNTKVITALGICKVCTEAVHSVAL